MIAWLALSTMAFVSAMPEHVQQRAGKKEQEGQDP
jgi:hypothetical protein